MKSPIRKAMHHPVFGSAIFEEGDEIPNGWYDSPADFPKEEHPAVKPTPMPSWKDDMPTVIEPDEPARKGGWPKGKPRK